MSRRSTFRGWPRPRAKYTPSGMISGERQEADLPVPWINGDNPFSNEWLAFPSRRSVLAVRQRRCAVCGYSLGSVTLLGVECGSETSGPGCHPRCMALALKTCPHLGELEGTVAWRYDGDGLGYSAKWSDALSPTDVYLGGAPVLPGCIALTAPEVRDLAAVDPMGEGAS